jgi:hypothetical protein
MGAVGYHDTYQMGYTQELVTSFTGTGGTELECQITRRDIVLHDVGVVWASPTDAHTFSVGTTTGGKEIVKDAYYNINNELNFSSFATTGRRLLLTTWTTVSDFGKIFINVSNGDVAFSVQFRLSHKLSTVATDPR